VKWWIWAIVAFSVYALFRVVKGIFIPASEADIEALGRMIISENGNDPEIVQVAIAWTAKNEAKRRKKSIADLVMPGGVPAPQTGRYASTARAATNASREIARKVIKGIVADPTGGAIQFDAPKTQDILYKQGKVTKTAAQIAASRIADGKEMVTVAGVDPGYMRWWRYS